MKELSDKVWVEHVPHKMFGLHIGSRMTLVRLNDGSLFLHSPILITEELKQKINSLGEVKHIVCPNSFHHMYASSAIETWPNAILHGSHGLSKKRKDLNIKNILSNIPHKDWEVSLQPLFIRGCLLEETVFYHNESGILITSDLTENFNECDHLYTLMYLKISGIHKKIGWSRLLHFLYKDKKLAKEDIQKILQWDIKKIIIAHGDIIENDVHNAIRQTFEFLG